MAGLGKVTHIGVCVSDMARSRRFYEEALGFRYLRELRVAGEPSDTLLRLSGTDLHAVYVERDGFCLELLHYTSPRSAASPPPHAMNDLGFTHLSIQVPSIEAAMATLRAAGAAILDSTLIEIGGRKVAVFLKDPDGLLIELVAAHPEA
jgi:catechol 2,3-dioxygenase-like lactoylglutathione lyase family enzyme